MTPLAIVQLSDTHLSRSRPFFQFNFEAALKEIAAKKPDLVIITGDLALNGPDDADDIAYAKSQFERINVPWLALPGNHDVGLHPFKGGLHQPINEARVATYHAVFGYDRFARDIADWKLVGINSQLVGSGLAAEEEQFNWLESEISGRSGNTALFLHYPLFLDDVSEANEVHSSLRPAARQRLLDLFAKVPGLKFVASGHLHQERRLENAGIVYHWAPATAFISTESDHGGESYCGFLVHHLRADGHATERAEPRLMINHDIRNWGRSEPHGYYDIVKDPFPQVA
jgi:alkaline phosphatase D